MSMKEKIPEYCSYRYCEVTAKEIVSVLYPGKHQSFVNSEITQLIYEGSLARNDNVKPYTVRLTKINEKITDIKNHSNSVNEKIFIGNNKNIAACKLPIDDAVKYIRDYYSETLVDGNGFHMSWQHCYNTFKEQRRRTPSGTFSGMV